MIKKRWKKLIAISSVVFILWLIPQLIPFGQTYASVNINASEHSGGFVIKADRVEGSIDLLGALFGKVNIGSGRIEGIEIFKALDTGEGETMNIYIESPGPVSISNLKAETIDGKMPSFGGLCLPSRLLWLCMTDVTMVVPWQEVQNLNLPNAIIRTCFANECPSASSKSIQNVDEGAMNAKAEAIAKILEEHPEKQEIIDAFIAEAQEKNLQINSEEFIDKIYELLTEEDKEEQEVEKSEEAQDENGSVSDEEANTGEEENTEEQGTDEESTSSSDEQSDTTDNQDGEEPFNNDPEESTPEDEVGTDNGKDDGEFDSDPEGIDKSAGASIIMRKLPIY